jgi:hypothetical protein
MKKINVALLGLSLGQTILAEAVSVLPPVYPLGFDHKKEAKKKKKLLRELARRQRNLDKLNNAR